MVRYYNWSIDDPGPDRTAYRKHMICAGIAIIDNTESDNECEGMRYYDMAIGIAALGFYFDSLQAVRKSIRRANRNPYDTINYADFRTINNLWLLVSCPYTLW